MTQDNVLTDAQRLALRAYPTIEDQRKAARNARLMYQRNHEALKRAAAGLITAQGMHGMAADAFVALSAVRVAAGQQAVDGRAARYILEPLASSAEERKTIRVQRRERDKQTVGQAREHAATRAARERRAEAQRRLDAEWAARDALTPGRRDHDKA